MNLKKFCFLVLLTHIPIFYTQGIPWNNGKLQVSEEGRYLRHENGKPFFWLGETGWLLPQRTDREEAEYYLERCRQAGYNVVQVQVLNSVPSVNAYGQLSHPDGYDFSSINKSGVYGYWDHMDYIIRTAARKGIYIGMVCIWGGPVKKGSMDMEQAKAYGEFLAGRYKNEPNIIWFIGGDVRGDEKMEEWQVLANTIRKMDKNHIMTFHPRGRTTSAEWFNNEEWLDFNMFQSGHRRYGQSVGDKNYLFQENTEEDNWRYVERCHALEPLKPVIDGEPVYEDIPQGLHNPAEPRWNEADVRRYAYWSVFAGSFGHTYGHNSIMQFMRPGITAAYGATTPWYEALDAHGFNQMKHLKTLLLAFPFFERIPDQDIIAGKNGERYERLIATRGNDYLFVYNYTAGKMDIDLTRIEGEKKNVWWYCPRTGELKFDGCYENRITVFIPEIKGSGHNDWVLIAFDSTKNYISAGLNGSQPYFTTLFDG